MLLQQKATEAESELQVPALPLLHNNYDTGVVLGLSVFK
jgi:hypothetical protein